MSSRSSAIAKWTCAAYALATSGWYLVWRSFFAERSADEAIFENMFWNAAHGYGLRSWIERGVPHLAVHFSPVLYLLLPLYRMGGMYAIHAVVSFATSLAGFAFYRHVARRVDPRAALPMMLALLLHPTVVLQTFMEFHEQALATLPIVLLLTAWEGTLLLRALWCAIGLLSVREDNLLLVLSLGLLALLYPSRRKLGVSLLATGTVWLVAWRAISFGWLGGQTLPGVFFGTYGEWGNSVPAILQSFFTHPAAVLRHFLAPVSLRYLGELFLPFLFVLPFGSARVLAMLPQLMLVLLAGHDTRMFEIRMHFSLVPVIVLYFASAASLARLGRTGSSLASRLRPLVPALMMSVVLVLVPVWAVRSVRRLNPYSAQIREMLATVPDTASVTAPGYLLNHLARRRQIALEWSEDIAHTECVILEDRRRFFFEGRTMDIFYSPRLDSLLTEAGYRKTFERNGLHVYRRAAPLR